MNSHLQRIHDLIKKSAFISAEDKSVLEQAIKDTEKEQEILSLKLDRTEEEKRTTAILLEETIQELEHKRKSIEVQNRELEIEAALERVRVVAMGMRKDDDLRMVCEALYKELKQLGFKNIRNAQGGIIDVENKTFKEYSYSDYGSSTTGVITKYTDDPLSFELVTEIQQSKDAFFKKQISGDEFESWRRWRIETGRPDDPLLEQASSTWFYIYSIGTGGIGISTLDAITEEQQLLLKRFKNVLELTYTRFHDLQKAKAQAREAQIEAALERVRAAAMAMHKSEDLNDTAGVVFEELDKLNLGMLRCGIGVINGEKRTVDVWSTSVTDHGNTVQVSGDESMDIHPLLQGAYDAWVRREDFSYVLQGEDLVTYYKAVEKTNIKLPELQQIKAEGSRQFYYVATFQAGGLYAYRETEFSGEAKAVMKRFANVFNLTYKRFLDLQKAEAQTRESQIQLALERVRARTMAMQKSDELPETSHMLFEQMKELGEPAEQLTIGIVREEDNVIEISATLHGNTLQNIYRHSIEEPYLMNRVYKAWKMQQKTLIVEMRGEEINAYNQYRNELTQTEMFPTTLSEENRRIVYAAFFSKGMLALGTNEPRPPQSLQLLERFASVFDLTYTRFLELEKAEAQVREADIQLALERVRARTMAMQKSEELPEAANVLFQQIHSLGMPVFAAGYCIWDDDKQAITLWMSTENVLQPPYKAPTTEDELFIEMRKGYEEGKLLHIVEMGGEELVAHYQYMRTLPVIGDVFDSILKAGHSFPTFQVMHQAYFSKGFLLFITYEPVPEAHNTFKRFANVFEQTYTRFLDLKTAEAQRREAQIELAVEKVRAKALAMHKSEDLHSVVVALKKELMGLHIPNITSATMYLAQDDGSIRILDLSDTGGDDDDKPQLQLDQIFRLEETDPDLWIRRMWNRSENYFVLEADEDDFARVVQWIRSVDPAGAEIAEKIIREKSIKKAWLPTVKLEKGRLNIDLLEPPTDEIKTILLKIGAAFDLAYRRFLDLQKAEAQAREAKIEASLERVRAKAMAMHKSEDLNMAVATVFEELDKLDLGMARCGISILDKEKRSADVFTTSISDEGKIVNVSGDESIDIHPLLQGAFDAWVKQSDFSYVLEGKDLARYYQAIGETNIRLPDSQIILSQAEEIKQYFYIATFQAGCLFAFRDASFSEEAKKVMKRFADVFNLTYTRFLDLQKAEAQAIEARFHLIQIEAEKQKAETALVELQATQEQLIQAEKMASLGELTAGIAHEIQNPLNFVNNFSEVNIELVEEMKQEIANKNLDEVIAIANDIKDNQEKITHHGKRADAIVKGMLQHSRTSSGQKEPTDINALVDEYLRLAYHGLRAKDKSFNAIMETDFDESIGLINIIPQDIGRVILNLITNAFYAVTEKKNVLANTPYPMMLRPANTQPDATAQQPGKTTYKPTVTVYTKLKRSPLGKSEVKGEGSKGETIQIRIKDNGNGIPQNILDKIFQPFYTTKPTGKGTGLGLSLSYDIIKAHGGELKVETTEGEYAEFIIQLPCK